MKNFCCRRLLELYAGKQPGGPHAVSNKSIDVENRIVILGEMLQQTTGLEMHLS